MTSKHLYALELERGGSASKEIVRLLRDAADDVDADGLYALASLYFHGRYVPKNGLQALRLLEEVATQMHPSELYDLGTAYEL